MQVLIKAVDTEQIKQLQEADLVIATNQWDTGLPGKMEIQQQSLGSLLKMLIVLKLLICMDNKPMDQFMMNVGHLLQKQEVIEQQQNSLLIDLGAKSILQLVLLSAILQMDM